MQSTAPNTTQPAHVNSNSNKIKFILIATRTVQS